MFWKVKNSGEFLDVELGCEIWEFPLSVIIKTILKIKQKKDFTVIDNSENLTCALNQVYNIWNQHEQTNKYKTELFIHFPLLLSTTFLSHSEFVIIIELIFLSQLRSHLFVAFLIYRLWSACKNRHSLPKQRPCVSRVIFNDLFVYEIFRNADNRLIRNLSNSWQIIKEGAFSQ